MAVVLPLAILPFFASCENADQTFDNFDYQTVYFGNQYPVRTLELGEDQEVDLTLDNQKRIEIKANIGGTRGNSQNIIIDYAVDNSLCDGLTFADDGSDVVALPESHYRLLSDKLLIPSGSFMGGVQIEFTDAFFADPMSLKRHYVIPIVMTKIIQGADSILCGLPQKENPDRCSTDDWTIQPKDFVLEAVRFVNRWSGFYLRKGVDKITDATGVETTVKREAEYVEKNEVAQVTTSGLTTCTQAVTIKDTEGKDYTFNVVLTFNDADNTCTLSSDSNDVTITGSGSFVSKGEKNSMGGSDRDAIYLKYTAEISSLGLTYDTEDTLILRNRGVAPGYFSVVRN